MICFLHSNTGTSSVLRGTSLAQITHYMESWNVDCSAGPVKNNTKSVMNPAAIYCFSKPKPQVFVENLTKKAVNISMVIVLNCCQSTKISFRYNTYSCWWDFGLDCLNPSLDVKPKCHYLMYINLNQLLKLFVARQWFSM